jgi:hypothetical protein
MDREQILNKGISYIMDIDQKALKWACQSLLLERLSLTTKTDDQTKQELRDYVKREASYEQLLNLALTPSRKTYSKREDLEKLFEKSIVNSTEPLPQDKKVVVDDEDPYKDVDGKSVIDLYLYKKMTNAGAPKTEAAMKAAELCNALGKVTESKKWLLSLV